ncbi:hypothetical protein [Allomuricauda sp. SCSIO 65647]|uniref:hypothetical protein n=1 Tax=Allomuricauda sp. SCSIO 65647 TaxID=2908843 RepID=UPI001F1E6C82|nr:hypothetical protein [Muricauda sp. SCSIO 65647]UJH67573.1 hypothetical protein L0P89_16695 [Muricauda sp. SCSIO 65647]
MKKLLLLIVLVMLVACGGVKKTQEALNSGNYATAMSKAITELSENKTKKGHQDYVLLLESAFQKYSKRELERITFLKKDGNPANYEAIYKGYVQLKNWQERIEPLLPLPIYDENRDAVFSFRNYNNDIIASKNALSEYLYANAGQLLESANSKADFRQAYNELAYLEEINPGYGDTAPKMEEAYQKGLDFVKVEINNDTEQVIPRRLEEELLDFNAYGLNNFWTQYHARPLKSVAYDYAMNVDFKEINISPEQVNERQITKERQVKDGYEYLYDQEGNIVKDSLGNKIKIDRMVTVRCDFYQFTQFKSAQIGAKVSFTDLHNGQVINSYPLSSEFIFEHIYANFDGDRRALDNDLVRLLNLGAVPFPTNEQMVYDAGEDLKLRLKDVIRRNSFN